MTHSNEDGIATILSAQRAEIVPRWVQVAASTARGRITATELERELAPILDQLIAGLEADESLGDSGFAEARALLAELVPQPGPAGLLRRPRPRSASSRSRRSCST